MSLGKFFSIFFYTRKQANNEKVKKINHELLKQKEKLKSIEIEEKYIKPKVL